MLLSTNLPLVNFGLCSFPYSTLNMKTRPRSTLVLVYLQKHISARGCSTIHLLVAISNVSIIEFPSNKESIQRVYSTLLKPNLFDETVFGIYQIYLYLYRDIKKGTLSHSLI